MTVDEALNKLANQLRAKREQVMDQYLCLLDQDGPLPNHARAVLDGRVGQIDLDLINIENVRRIAAVSTATYDQPMRCRWCDEVHGGGPENCGRPEAKPALATAERTRRRKN